MGQDRQILQISIFEVQTLQIFVSRRVRKREQNIERKIKREQEQARTQEEERGSSIAVSAVQLSTPVLSLIIMPISPTGLWLGSGRPFKEAELPTGETKVSQERGHSFEQSMSAQRQRAQSIRVPQQL